MMLGDEVKNKVEARYLQLNIYEDFLNKLINDLEKITISTGKLKPK